MGLGWGSWGLGNRRVNVMWQEEEKGRRMDFGLHMHGGISSGISLGYCVSTRGSINQISWA